MDLSTLTEQAVQVSEMEKQVQLAGESRKHLVRNMDRQDTLNSSRSNSCIAANSTNLHWVSKEGKWQALNLEDLET